MRLTVVAAALLLGAGPVWAGGTGEPSQESDVVVVVEPDGGIVGEPVFTGDYLGDDPTPPEVVTPAPPDAPSGVAAALSVQGSEDVDNDPVCVIRSGSSEPICTY